MRPKNRPVSAELRAYQVGFGDCFLLSFEYPNQQQRHVLIDFGSTGLKKTKAGSDQLLRIAEDIRQCCNGKLHAVVATHRHKDHISGFATKKNGRGSGDIIAACAPDVVVQPWTEDPAAKPDARAAAKGEPGPKSFVQSLEHMHQVSEAILAETRRTWRRLTDAVADELRFLGDDNLKNQSAIENLMRMGKKGKAFYVNCGSPSGLERVLPGVTVKVLGPPNLEQSEAIRKQRARDKDEFWQFQKQAADDKEKFWQFQAQAGQMASGTLELPFAHAEIAKPFPPETRWLIGKMRKIRGDQMLRIVRALDKEMNNTSVILLLQIGETKLLFPGDAQIENWSYCLSQPKYRTMLKSVDLYKVGHHGSLNATPRKSLWALFAKRSKKDSPRRLRTVVSTMADKHGDRESRTEVPRRTLMSALKAESNLVTTQDIDGDALSRSIRINFAKG